MGRIKSTPVKKLGNELIKESKDKYSLDFTKNKSAIKGAREIKSKKTLNLVAGYITNEMKKTKRNEERLSRRAEMKSQNDDSNS